MMRVTDLEKFALEQVWWPYQNMMGYERRLERLPVGLEETVRLLRADTTGWSKRVIDRIQAIGITFPDYIRHPLVDVFGGGTKSDGLLEGSLPSGESEPLVTTASAPSDTVDCPDCRGSGSRAISVAGCCENPTRTGECCGNAIEVPGYEECSSCGGSGMVPGPSDPAQEPSVTTFGGSSPCLGRPGDARNTYVDAQEPEAVAYLHRHRKFGRDLQFTQLEACDREQGWTEEPLYRTRPVSLDREAVARIIDPDAFEAWDRAEGNWRKDEAKVHCWPAEEKAVDVDPLIDQLRGRAKFLRDAGEIKSPELMERAVLALRLATEPRP